MSQTEQDPFRRARARALLAALGRPDPRRPPLLMIICNVGCVGRRDELKKPNYGFIRAVIRYPGQPEQPDRSFERAEGESAKEFWDRVCGAAPALVPVTVTFDSPNIETCPAPFDVIDTGPPDE